MILTEINLILQWWCIWDALLESRVCILRKTLRFPTSTFLIGFFAFFVAFLNDFSSFLVLYISYIRRFHFFLSFCSFLLHFKSWFLIYWCNLLLFRHTACLSLQFSHLMLFSPGWTPCLFPYSIFHVWNLRWFSCLLTFSSILCS